jgi:hypothetical protein
MFADPGEAIEFIDVLRELKLRDGFQVFAWSLLSNHYHLAVRTSAVPLARTMGTASGEDRRPAGKAPDVVSRWARAGAEWRSKNPVFAKAIDESDSLLADSARQ